ncbi:M23 family metallopeptidase [Tessaracoccus aquimaris]|nr:M23 family metallopeptidase [Tessaracoccus aquimaris]
MDSPVALRFPFTGRWRVENSPARRVPSHGTELFGTAYAIDFVRVDDRGRSAPRTLRSLLATEPPERFVGFGSPILAPLAGEVVLTHDGEPDHDAYRSFRAQLGYAATQAARVRRGASAVAGNHVVIRSGDVYVLLAHLQRGSLAVGEGQILVPGQTIGACGNSGNSTEPHVHVQATDGIDWARCRALPIAFQRRDEAPWLPAERDVVEA